MNGKLASLVILVLTISLAPGIVSSAAEDKDKAIMELFNTMKTRENLEKSLATMEDSIKMNAPYFLKEVKGIMARDMAQEDVNIAAKAYNENDFGAKRIYEIFRYKFSVDRVINEIMIPLYKDNYNEEEIRQLIQFYNSDVGQKSLKLTPTIMGEISSQTRDMTQMALSQAKEELAFELRKNYSKE